MSAMSQFSASAAIAKVAAVVVVVVALAVLAGENELSADAVQSSIARSTLLNPAQVTVTADEVIASGFDHPVHLTHAGDDSGRVFVVEQSGTIRIIEDGRGASGPFLDIADRVMYGGERGLLSVAFPPGYADKGYFYINYTRQPDGSTVVARYRITEDPDVADKNSEEVLLTVQQPYANHNGGQLAFGPDDGYLYIGMGDGGSAGDPENNAQNTDSLLGKMLRIDVESGADPYAIPEDNPFANVSGYRSEIWALGLRNPWRFSFDRATGDLYVGDVGQNAWEEIDYEAAHSVGGLNFAWRCKEATHDYEFAGACPALVLTDPIAEYGRDEGASVTGGFVYRGTRYPALMGRYFFADYVSGKLWSMHETGPGTAMWTAPELVLDTGLNISSFGEDEEGELYVVDYAGGTVRRLSARDISDSRDG